MPPDPKEDKLHSVGAVLTELTALKTLNSRRASYSLVGLALVFVLSLFFFLFSTQLFSEEKEKIDTRELETSIEAELSALSKEAGKILTQLDEAARKEESEGKESVGISAFSPQSATISTSVSALKENYENLTRRKSSLLTELDTLQARRLDELKLVKNTQSVENIVATSITRLGAVLLAVFMMQILLGFYKYFMRLTNFYGAKIVVAKSLGENDNEALRELVNSLAIDGIDFGKEPAMPYDKVIELLKSTK